MLDYDTSVLCMWQARCQVDTIILALQKGINSVYKSMLH
jgi:hypothetical protein